MKHDYVLLTGATGLLGQYLMRDLLREGTRLAVAIRGSEKRSAEERLEQILQYWEAELGESLPRPVCLSADITQPRCGMNSHDLKWAAEHCSQMFHCAASLTFQEYRGEPWRTNVEGTRQVLRFCQEAAIRQMHYVSTAYVCGRRDDLVLENELDVGQEFRNDYEKSKFLAEKMMREEGEFDKLTVYRPVVITGDSRTGFTSTYHGSYLYIKLASVLAKNMEPDAKGNHHIPIRWGATGEERRNITPVDWNSEIICRLFHNPAAHGLTFQLAPREPLNMRKIIDYAARFFRITGIEFHGYGDNPDFKLNELERWIWSNVKIYGAYDFWDARFDTTNLDRFAGDHPSPYLDYEIAERLIRYAEEDRWGKRRLRDAQPAPCDVRRVLSQWSSADENQLGLASQEVGLDILGPGGGPFRIQWRGDRIVGFQRGLPSCSANAPLLRLTSQQLADLETEYGASAGGLRHLLQATA
jgi:nucleoside-diphosphate-sugar epimerase